MLTPLVTLSTTLSSVVSVEDSLNSLNSFILFVILLPFRFTLKRDDGTFTSCFCLFLVESITSSFTSRSILISSSKLLMLTPLVTLSTTLSSVVSVEDSLNSLNSFILFVILLPFRFTLKRDDGTFTSCFGLVLVESITSSFTSRSILISSPKLLMLTPLVTLSTTLSSVVSVEDSLNSLNSFILFVIL